MQSFFSIQRKYNCLYNYIHCCHETVRLLTIYPTIILLHAEYVQQLVLTTVTDSDMFPLRTTIAQSIYSTLFSTFWEDITSMNEQTEINTSASLGHVQEKVTITNFTLHKNDFIDNEITFKCKGFIHALKTTLSDSNSNHFLKLSKESHISARWLRFYITFDSYYITQKGVNVCCKCMHMRLTFQCQA